MVRIWSKVKLLIYPFPLFLSCLDNTPELKKWTERMSEDAAVKATMHSVDTHKAFYKGYVEGTPNYDYGL